MRIHHEIGLDAAPRKIYDALTDAKQFGSGEDGGGFSVFGGMIEGRNLELVPGKRVVQAWRAKNWEPGLFSIARFELQPKEKGTRIVFDHVGFPDAERDHLDKGWTANYWDPLRKLSAP